MEARRTLKEKLSPNPEYCFGRQALCDRLQATPYGEGATFLFGGILTGKTTLLLRVQSNLLNEALARLGTSEVILPVYVDLRLASYTDSHTLFQSLLLALEAAFERLLPEFRSPPETGAQAPLDIGVFAAGIDQVFTAAGSNSFRILFLLDNCEQLRALPQGLQANLVWLLWGEGEFQCRNKVSMIMAGGQDMRTLLIDSTTVMATKATQEYIFNLSFDDVLEMAQQRYNPANAKTISQEVYEATGGHAGLTHLLLVELGGKSLSVAEVAERVVSEKEEVLRRINDGLSIEAAAIQHLLRSGGPVTGPEVETRLQTSGLDRFKRPLCLRELRFSGVAVGNNAQIRPVGTMYWNFYVQFGEQPAVTTSELLTGEINVFKKDGTTWVLAFKGKQCHTEHTIGLLRIQRLLRRCSKWVSAVELAQEQEIESNQAIENEKQAREIAGDLEGSQPKAEKRVHVDDIIDRETATKVKEAIKDLEREIKHLESAPDDNESLLTKNKDNLGQLRRYLANSSRASTPSAAGAKSRKFTTHDEKARKAVGKSIREAIKQVRKDGLPELADHLDDYIRYECYEYAYLPGNSPPLWKL